MKFVATFPLLFLSAISAAFYYESASNGYYLVNVGDVQKVKHVNNGTSSSPVNVVQEDNNTSDADFGAPAEEIEANPDNTVETLVEKKEKSQPEIVDNKENKENNIIAKEETKALPASPPATPDNYNAKTKAFTSCTSADRRALADNLSASEDHWKAMTECTVRSQTHDKLGHFFLHVSKSGGTSMRAAMDNTKCFQSGRNAKKKLFYVLERPDTHWFKYSKLRKEGLNLEKFGRIDNSRVQGGSCQHLKGIMNEQGRLAVESESVIAFEEKSAQIDPHHRGGCRQLVNSIIFREPLARIESHYKHLKSISRGSNDHKMFLGGGLDQVFNVTFMTEVFDVVSDNYYTRSLVANGIYQHGEPLTQHPDAWTTIFPTANASLHNIDWIMLMGSPNQEEAEDRNLILQNGLGLGPQVNLGHSRPGSQQLKKSKLSDERLLKDRNALDYKLWEEALKLNRLDVISLKRMQPYYEAALEATKPERSDHCCGLVCWKKKE